VGGNRGSIKEKERERESPRKGGVVDSLLKNSRELIRVLQKSVVKSAGARTRGYRDFVNEYIPIE